MYVCGVVYVVVELVCVEVGYGIGDVGMCGVEGIVVGVDWIE